MDIISHVLPKKTAASWWKPVTRFTASSSQKATNWERDDFSREGRRSILHRHWAYIHYRERIPVLKPHSLHGDVWSYTATTMWGHQRWTEVSERRTQLRHTMCNQPRFSDGAVRPSFTCIYLTVQAHFLTRALWDLWKYVQGQKSRSKTLHLPQDISGFINEQRLSDKGLWNRLLAADCLQPSSGTAVRIYYIPGLNVTQAKILDVDSSPSCMKTPLRRYICSEIVPVDLLSGPRWGSHFPAWPSLNLNLTPLTYDAAIF